MKIEIVEFYPDEKEDINKQTFKGSMHVYLCDHNIDVRGIRVIKTNKGLLFELPKRPGKDPLNGKQCFYPIFNFTDPEVSKEFRDLVIKLGKEYVLNYIEENKKEKTDDTQIG